MIATALFMVASADIVRERDMFPGVNIPAETAFLMTDRATVTASNSFIGLENESVVNHKY